MPAVELWINEVPQFFDDNGDPLAFGQLFFYEAGSSNKLNTYTDSSGTVPNANPMVLDAAGRPLTAIWLIANQLYKIGLATATEPDPPNNFIPSWPIDNVEGIAGAASAVTEWVASGFTPTYVSATSFTVPGDQTSILTVGRAVQIIDAGGTKYGWIKTSGFAALTTIVLDQNSDALANPVSSVAYGILQGTADSSTPILPDSFPLRGGSSDRSKQASIETDQNTTAQTRQGLWPDYNFRFMTQTKGATVGVANPNWDAWDGDWADMSTSPLTPTLGTGRVFAVRLTGVGSITASANLIPLTGVNLPVEAGDWAVFRGDAAGVVRMESYSRFSGQPITFGRSNVTGLGGTSVDIAIPSYAIRLTVMVFEASTNGTSPIILQLGDSVGIENTGYIGATADMATTVATTTWGAGVILTGSVAAGHSYSGKVVLDRANTGATTWSANTSMGESSIPAFRTGAGYKTLSDPLTQIRITTAGGANTFDAGTVIVNWE